MPRVVTLTTDFGAGSGYVAELKGRLLHAKAAFTLVDIAHDVPPQDVRAAAWLVGQACPAFPRGSLHIVVVDPGVGTDRRLVWARIGEQEFLGPDNGVFSRLLAGAPARDARVLPIAAHASATFHGRDVLAPAAVALLDGLAPESLGPPAGSLATLGWPMPVETAAGVAGEVIHVDAFGNLITNLPAALWPRLAAAGSLRVGDHAITTLARTYGDARPDTLVALVGSQGFIEIAVVRGNAATRLAAGQGTQVLIPA
ncbi:MAG: SAM-dependent chlorinase/fluorinase [Planctomycetes bacterium]|nr:SAM-dependent chlorinase/fluorinase [Planctomycetota bacterium]